MNLVFLLIVVLAEMVGTIAGFGSSTVLLPIALFFLDFSSALVLVAIVHIMGNLAKIGWFRKEIDNHLFFSFGIPSVLASILGASLVAYLPTELLKGLLGVFLVIYVLVSWKGKGMKVEGNGEVLAVGGGLSGFLAGLIGTGGALRGAFLSAYGLKKEKYIATMAMVAVLVDLVRLPVYLKHGFLNAEYRGMVPLLMILAVVGAWIGKEVVKRVSTDNFKKIVLLAIGVIGVKLVFDWIVIG